MNKSNYFILGYLRVFLSIASFYYMPTHPSITIVCYLTSEFLDALDGHAARALGQCKLMAERNPFLFDLNI